MVDVDTTKEIMYTLMITLYLDTIVNNLIFLCTPDIAEVVCIAIEYCRDKLNAEQLYIVYSGANTFEVYYDKQLRGLFSVDQVGKRARNVC